MKHGGKEKGKASKASGKKSSSKAGAPGKASGQAKKVASAGNSAKKGSARVEAVAKSSTPEGGNGKTKPRQGSDSGGFTNPLVAAAFKRALKKYPNTFRKLSD